MKKFYSFILILLAVLPVSAKSWTAEQVKGLIFCVNTYWQKNNKAEVNAFWDNAVYHTGNMEVYKLFQDAKQLNYSSRWAYANNWSGATEADPRRWKYKTGSRNKEFVRVGGWEGCVET